MKIIASMTMLFLPGTFVAVRLSTLRGAFLHRSFLPLLICRAIRLTNLYMPDFLQHGVLRH